MPRSVYAVFKIFQRKLHNAERISCLTHGHADQHFTFWSFWELEGAASWSLSSGIKMSWDALEAPPIPDRLMAKPARRRPQQNATNESDFNRSPTRTNSDSLSFSLRFISTESTANLLCNFTSAFSFAQLWTCCPRRLCKVASLYCIFRLQTFKPRNIEGSFSTKMYKGIQCRNPTWHVCILLQEDRAPRNPWVSTTHPAFHVSFSPLDLGQMHQEGM